jgi:hypothetical protein
MRRSQGIDPLSLRGVQEEQKLTALKEELILWAILVDCVLLHQTMMIWENFQVQRQRIRLFQKNKGTSRTACVCGQ